MVTLKHILATIQIMFDVVLNNSLLHTPIHAQIHQNAHSVLKTTRQVKNDAQCITT